MQLNISYKIIVKAPILKIYHMHLKKIHHKKTHLVVVERFHLFAKKNNLLREDWISLHDSSDLFFNGHFVDD